MFFTRVLLSCVFFMFILHYIKCEEKKKVIGKKNIVDLNDADVEKLYEQWEENDPEQLPEDEKEHYIPKRPNINLEDIRTKGPDAVKRLSKKGQALMLIVTLTGKPTMQETEYITNIWQTSLFNANYELTRYVIDENQAIFMIKDGSYAWEIKDFLIKQERCEEVTIDQEKYAGLHSSKAKEAKAEKTDL